MTDPSKISELAQEISSLVDSFSTNKTLPNASRRHALVVAAEKLAIAVRGPEENLYFTATRTAQNAAIRSAIGMNIFKIVPAQGGTISADEIAQLGGADKQLVVRIMRACTASHIFTEVGEELYAHNVDSRIFSKEQNRDMFKQMYDFVGKGTYALPEHLKKTNWKNPENYNDSAFHLGQNTNLGFWEYLEAVPERLETFNSGMRSKASVTTVASVYPFDVELNRDPVTADDVVLVDVGGGRGQVLERIKNEFPGLQGQLVLQDQERVIADAVSRGLPPFIRAQPASFFDVNPVKGARAYHFRRIFHDWSDSASIEILRNTVAAMTSMSRVLISDNDVPVQGAPAHMALQDLNMMSFAGMERTMKQWSALLDRAGLSVVKIWRVDGNDHVMIEARLRDAE